MADRESQRGDERVADTNQAHGQVRQVACCCFACADEDSTCDLILAIACELDPLLSASVTESELSFSLFPIQPQRVSVT